MFKCFDLYLSHILQLIQNSTFISGLCIFRDDYSLIDNDIIKEGLSHIIKYLCVS